MRAVCLGDSQLGVATVPLTEQEAVWGRIVDLAIDQRADVVLHGGDLFEHVHVTSDVYAAFRRPLARLREAGIPMLLIRGNHDGATRPIDALDVFREYPNLTVSQRPDLHEIEGVGIVTLPWTSPAPMIAARNGNVPRDQIYEEAARLLLMVAAEKLEEARSLYDAVILLAHWSISSASLPNGLPVADLKEPILEWADLDALGFDAVVASHIHAAQSLDDPHAGDATVGFYTGSPQQLNYGEHGEHGAWVIDVQPHPRGAAISTEFVPLSSPQFLTVDLDGLPIDRGYSEKWPLIITEGSFVRLRYPATREQDAALDKSAIRRELESAGAARVDFRPVITREVRARVETMTDDLTPLNALSLYCETQDTDIALRNRMLLRLGEWIA